MNTTKIWVQMKRALRLGITRGGSLAAFGITCGAKQLCYQVAVSGRSDKLNLLPASNYYSMSIEKGDRDRNHSNSEKNSEVKKFDRRTGKEVVTSPPHPGFAWREGHVLRALSVKEAEASTRTTLGQMLGDVPLFVEHCEAVAAEIDVKRRWLDEQGRRVSFCSGVLPERHVTLEVACAPSVVGSLWPLPA
jgi:hypothetical protein